MMAVAKKDQERANYAWMYGAQARKDVKERAAPDYWQEHADAWLRGFDGAPTGDQAKPVRTDMEAEVDEAAVGKSAPGNKPSGRAYRGMSTRGINFLNLWLASNVPETAKAAEISDDDLSNKLVADAKALGIKRGEIDEEVHSLYRAILDAIVHYDPGLPEQSGNGDPLLRQF